MTKPTRRPMTPKPRSELKLSPINLAADCWIYEERNGLTIVVESRMKDGSYIKTDQYRIPVGVVRDYLRRLDADASRRLNKGEWK